MIVGEAWIFLAGIGMLMLAGFIVALFKHAWEWLDWIHWVLFPVVILIVIILSVLGTVFFISGLVDD